MTSQMKTAAQWDAEAAELEKQAEEFRGEAAAQRRRDQAAARLKAAEVPVDRSAVQLTTGEPVPADGSHIEHDATGMQKGYVVLSESERAKGFVRPFRDSYRHLKCGKITTMARSLGETYARDPAFYSGTFCSTCREHFPVGETGEFTWYEMDGREGPKVGT